jgi:hypothetical protein
VGSGIGRDAATLSLMWMRPAKPHGNEPCPVIGACLPLDADLMRNVAPGYTGRKRGEVVGTRTVALQRPTRQWIGTYAGQGNGDSPGERSCALRSMTTSLRGFALSAELAQGESRWALWRHGSPGSTA